MPKSSKSISVLRLIVINAVIFLLLYALIELSYSGYRYLRDPSPDSFSVFEHPGETIKFDPIRGYYLTRTPSRMARVNFGQIETRDHFRATQKALPIVMISVLSGHPPTNGALRFLGTRSRQQPWSLSTHPTGQTGSKIYAK